MRATEAVAMPRRIIVHDSTFTDRQATLGARLAVLPLVTRYTDDIAASWYEAAGSYLYLTDDTDKTLGVPLTTTMFVLLHTGTKDLFTECASGRKHELVAGSAV